jgi:hypothetical protein
LSINSDNIISKFHSHNVMFGSKTQTQVSIKKCCLIKEKKLPLLPKTNMLKKTQDI